jgi:cytochrome P450
MLSPVPGPSLDSELGPLLRSEPASLAAPQLIYRRLREEAPVHRHGPIVLVARHADVRPLLRDEERFSKRFVVNGTRADAVRASLNPEQLQAFEAVTSFELMYVSRSDGEQHDRLRGIAHRVFTPRRIALIGDAIQSYTDGMLDAMDDGGVADIVSMLAYPLPLQIISDMLGVPKDEREQIHRWSQSIGRNRGGDNPDALMEAYAALQEFRHYVEDILVPLRSSGGGTDLLTALLEAEGDDRLSPQELSAMFIVLLFAGHETTTNLISIGLLELLRHRDQWDVLCADPSLTGGATEELLRWVTPVQWQPRVAIAAAEVRGVAIEPGDTVFLMLAAANRDEAVFVDAERLDVTREDAGAHLALGFGPHFCLGNALARLEGAVVLQTLVTRYPDLRLASDDLEWGGNGQLRSLRALPVDLGRRAN